MKQRAVLLTLVVKHEDYFTPDMVRDIITGALKQLRLRNLTVSDATILVEFSGILATAELT